MSAPSSRPNIGNHTPLPPGGGFFITKPRRPRNQAPPPGGTGAQRRRGASPQHPPCELPGVTCPASYRGVCRNPLSLRVRLRGNHMDIPQVSRAASAPKAPSYRGGCRCKRLGEKAQRIPSQLRLSRNPTNSANKSPKKRLPAFRAAPQPQRLPRLRRSASRCLAAPKMPCTRWKIPRPCIFRRFPLY